MSRAYFLILVFFVFMVFSVSVGATGWYSAEPNQTGKHGWYAYEKYEKPKKKKEKKKSAHREKKPSFRWPTYEEALRMKPSELKELLKKATEEAVANPTEENILRWTTYMKATRVKARRFAGAVSYVLLKHPELSYAPEFPINYPASHALALARARETQDFFRNLKDQFALILLKTSRSPLSEPAEKICRLFAAETGWKFVAVDADRNPTIVARFGAKYLPQAFIISRNPDVPPLPVMTGATALSTLKRNVYTMVRIALGEIPPTGFGSYKIKGLVPAAE